MDGAYTLKRQAGGRGHFASVQLTLAAGTKTDVSVAADAFNWLLDVYGPNANVEPYHQLYGPEAIAGVLLALGRENMHARVVIRIIHVAPADTGPGDVHLAAAYAVRDALGKPPLV